MPSASIVTLSNEIVTYLTSAVTAASGTISRQYIPLPVLENMALQVSVVPRQEERGRVARGAWFRRYTIDVGIQNRNANVISDTDVDMALGETLADLLQGFTESTVKVALINVNMLSNYDPDHLAEFKLFTCVIRLLFERWA